MSLAFSTAVFAAPDWGQSVEIAGMKVFPDTVSSTTFYHTPAPLVLAVDEMGQPEAKLYSLLYSGQSWLGHDGFDIKKGQFTAKFSRDPAHTVSVQRVREILQSRTGSNVTLKPAPVARLDASFRVPVKGEGGQIVSVLLSGHKLREDAPLKNESVAKDLQLTTHLEGDSLVILRNLFLDGNASASLDYAYIAADAGAENETVLTADSVPISVDLQRWPELSLIRDMAQLARDGYPILQVICDDFQKDSPGIEEKAVDIEAQSVSGRRVATTVIFTADADAPTLVPVDFTYAVRVDRPYVYRTRTIDLDGEETVTPWTSAADWAGWLDVTDRDYETTRPRRNYASEEAAILNEANP